MKVLKVVMLWSVAMVMAAQPIEVSGPISGLVFDSRAAAIRPIIGLPGAAYVGDVLVGGLEWAAVAPGGRAALALKEGTLYGLDGLERLEPVWRAVEGAAVRADWAAWSPEGSVAVIYSSVSGLAQVIRGLPGLPAASEPVAIGADISALAVDSQGRVVAALADGLYLISPGAPPVLLAAAAGVRAVAVAEGSLWIAAAEGQIMEIRDYAAQAKVLALAEVRDPVGLAVSADRKALLVASRAERAVEVYDLVSRTPAARLSLDSDPGALQSLAVRDLWLLRAPAGDSEPLLVLKADPDPSVWFVPVGRGE